MYIKGSRSFFCIYFELNALFYFVLDPCFFQAFCFIWARPFKIGSYRAADTQTSNSCLQE